MKNKIKYQWIIFDADGTLFDYDKAEYFALENAFIHFDIKFSKEYAFKYHNINANIWWEYEKGLISQKDLRTARFIRLFNLSDVTLDPAKFSEVYLSYLSKTNFLISGAKELISQLSSRFKLMMMTNGLQDVQNKRFQSSSLQPYFSNIIISEQAGAAKPDPWIFDIAFNKMDNPDKDLVLIVGDSLTSDIQGGINYGIDTCWFNPDRKQNTSSIIPTCEINALTDLIHLIQPSNL